MLTKCGIDCNECYAFSKDCPGCEAVAGQPFWTEQVGVTTCAVYQCCAAKDFENCGKCQDLPCRIWYDLKDPSMSDADHVSSINRRAGLLKGNCSEV
ncbi:MAG TPA: DUF3795 domain-containing protein [Bacillota bacterium]|nr:DUF3795 domain-containing protein [Bacillota bacterium]